MQIKEAELKGLYVVEPQKFEDDRGFFFRTFCQETFLKAGLPDTFPQCNTSFNLKRGTLRGMHFQKEPHPEGKLVRCTRGRIIDVALDLRPESSTYMKWQQFELSAENGLAIYIPEGMAHGFQTLEDNSEVFYMMTENYHPELAAGYRWNDPAFKIDWPIDNPIMSEKDGAYADFRK